MPLEADLRGATYQARATQMQIPNDCLTTHCGLAGRLSPVGARHARPG